MFIVFIVNIPCISHVYLVFLWLWWSMVIHFPIFFGWPDISGEVIGCRELGVSGGWRWRSTRAFHWRSRKAKKMFSSSEKSWAYHGIILTYNWYNIYIYIYIRILYIFTYLIIIVIGTACIYIIIIVIIIVVIGTAFIHVYIYIIYKLNTFM